ncbi:MAG: hypothetical protein GYB65_05025 [Chloroflexi bacterium]|nr:hypothetical protein [Chloroflexota bacterium]
MSDIRSQIEQLQADIEEQETILGNLEAEVLDVEQELSEFAAQYDRLIEPMNQRLDIVRDAIKELEEQQQKPLDLAGSPLESSWTPPPGYVSVEEQFKRAWARPDDDDDDFAPLESSWKPPENYVPVEEQFRRAWQKPGEAPPTSTSTGSQYVRSGNMAAQDLKKLFRKLVRRYHPDLTTDMAERKRRNRLMAEINEAYSQRDAEALRALAEQPDGTSLDQPISAMQLRQLQQVNEQLSRRLIRLRRQRDDLLHSDLMALKIKQSFAAREGRDLLQEMADELEREYTVALRKLDQLRGL